MYYYGLGMHDDDAKAFEWYQKSAEQGNVKAQDSLNALKEKGYQNPLSFFANLLHGKK